MAGPDVVVDVVRRCVDVVRPGLGGSDDGEETCVDDDDDVVAAGPCDVVVVIPAGTSAHVEENYFIFSIHF